MSHCELDHHHDPSAGLLETPIECSHCGARIPASTALNFEGEDYLRHFCGAGCLADWCRKAEGAEAAAPCRPQP